MALGHPQALREVDKNPLLISRAARERPPGQGQKNKTKMPILLLVALKAAAFCARRPACNST